ncbi:MAG: DUF3352 domain-containing protein [Phormidesmis sp.]
MTSKFALRSPIKQPARLLLLGAAFLVSGGAIAYLNFSQRVPRSLSPAGTQLVPQTAVLAMTVTTDELTWTRLRQFGTADSQQQFDAMLSAWKARLTDSGYRFKRDIKPWIGDRVTLAVLSAQPPASADPSEQPEGLATAAQNLVLIAPIADPLKAKSLLAEGPSGSDVSQQERTYRGIDTQTITTKDGETFETAVLGTNWLLLASTTDALDQAIDTYKGGRSLLDIAGYRQAATRAQPPQPPGKNFAQLYLNIPAATQILEVPPTDPAGAPNPPKRGSILPLQGSQGIFATALIESEGIRFQGTSWLFPEKDLAYSNLSNAAEEMPRRLPSDTLMMMSGSNLQQLWQSFSQGNSSPPFFPNPQNLKAGLLTQTGLDLDEDIMPWAAGEFALGLLPPAVQDAQTDAPTDSDANDSIGDPSERPADPAVESAPLLIMVQTNDRKLAESAWAQLDDVMTSRYRYQVETQRFEGGSITQWISPFQGVKFSHGWLPGNVAFFAIGEGAAEAIAPAPDRALASSPLFQTLNGQTDIPNNGHFYIDLAQINTLEGNIFPLPQLSPAGPTAAIEAIGLTSTVADRTMDYDLYIKLAKGAKPKPL